MSTDIDLILASRWKRYQDTGSPIRGRAGIREEPDSATGQGIASQFDRAYSVIVRSLENFPEQATLRMALRPHSWR
jgi:hypothetical protein